MDISWIGIRLIYNYVNSFHWYENTLGAASSLGCIIGFVVGGFISQYLGKRIIMVGSNLCSFIMWIMLAFKTVTVESIILERFSMVSSQQQQVDAYVRLFV